MSDISEKTLCVRYCEVINVKDDTDSDMIQVHLHPEDDNIPPQDIPYAFPLLPKMFHVKPKKGEAVLLFLSVSNDGKISQRYYIGPVISQDHKIYMDEYLMGGSSYQAGSIKKFDEAPATDPEKTDTLPVDEDVCIRGRKNSDIQITEDDIRLKSGVKLANECNKSEFKFNKDNPSFLKLKYHPGGLYTNEDLIKSDTIGKKQCNSTATIVADKINLLSRKSDKTFDLVDEKNLVSDDTLKEVIEKAYKLPYGEKLVEILSLLIDAFINHTHPFPMEKPCNEDGIPELNDKKAAYLDKGEMLSDTIRIN